MLELKQTCNACPEQYNVYLEDKIVGYIRLRWGIIRANLYDGETMGDVIFHDVIGDGLQGQFESDKERIHYLNQVVLVIQSALSLGEDGKEIPIYKLREDTNED